MVVAFQQLLNPYFGGTLLLSFFFFFFFKGSASLGAFIADPEFFFFLHRRGGEKLLLFVIKAVHASIPLLGFCLDQTELTLWSRQTRDKEVSGRTLASLGISFTGVEEAHTL